MRQLGQASSSEIDVAAWEAYLRSIRDGMNAAWGAAVGARQVLRDVRERLGLPFMVPPGEVPSAVSIGAWDQGFEQNFVELGSLVATLTRFVDDALAGGRRFGTDQAGEWGLERLETDATRVEVRAIGGRPRPVEISNATNEPIVVTGTVGALPALAIAAIAIAATVTAYFVVTEICETVEKVAEQKTFETISTNQTEQIRRGATPEQARALSDSIFQGAAQVHEARAVEAGARRARLPDGIVTLGLIALGIAGIFFASRFIGGRGTPAALAPARALLDNPVRRSGDARVNIRYRDEFDDYAGVVTWPGGSWRFEQLRPPRMGVAGGPPVPGLDIAVDSPRAYDVMAATALSFASDEEEEIFQHADFDFDQDRFRVRRR